MPPKKTTKQIPMPSVKMKGLNWTKIPPSKVSDTIFGNFGDLIDIDIDFTDIESQLAAKVIEKKGTILSISVFIFPFFYRSKRRR